MSRPFRQQACVVSALCLLLVTTPLWADEWTWPKQRDYPSTNGKYVFRVTPDHGISLRMGWGLGELYKTDGQKRSLVWKRYLVNDIAPVNAIVADSGSYVVTFDEWHEVGKLPVVIYDFRGGLVKVHNLEALFEGHEIPGEVSISSRWWDKDSLIFFGPKDETLYIRVCTGQTLMISMSDGDLIKESKSFLLDEGEKTWDSLVAYGKKRPAELALKYLESEDSERRRTGAIVAGQMGLREAIPRLRGLLKDDSYYLVYRGGGFFNGEHEHYVADAAREALESMGAGATTEPVLLRTFDGQAEEVCCVAFNPDGKTLAAGITDKTIKVWDLATGNDIATLDGHSDNIGSVVFSPDGKTLASRRFGAKTIKLWSLATGERTATLKGHTDAVESVAFSPDGKTLASGSDDKTIELWDVATGRNIATLKGHADPVVSVAYCPDGKSLISASKDKTIRLWDVATGKITATFDGHSDNIWGVAVSPNGKTLAARGFDDNTIRLWDLAAHKTSAVLKGHTSFISCVVFSPDGKTLASGSADKSVRLWDVASGRNTATFRHIKDVVTVAFSRDGKTLASGSWDGTFKLWDVKPGNAVAKARKKDGG
jgi:WD40 repeat protein